VAAGPKRGSGAATVHSVTQLLLRADSRSHFLSLQNRRYVRLSGHIHAISTATPAAVISRLQMSAPITIYLLLA
jgi:hypothetical protein